MKVWTCDDHAGFYPVGAASVIEAATEEEARLILRKALETKGLDGTGFTIELLDTSSAGVTVICDGNY